MLATSADTTTAQELSWRHSWLLRWGFPALLTLAAIWFIWEFAIRAGKPGVIDVLMSVAGAAVCMCYARYLDRAKRVWLGVDEIVVSDYKQTITIPRAEIAEVAPSSGLWPARIRIELKNPSAFGTRIFFFPVPVLNREARRQIVASLTD